MNSLYICIALDPSTYFEMAFGFKTISDWQKLVIFKIIEASNQTFETIKFNYWLEEIIGCGNLQEQIKNNFAFGTLKVPTNWSNIHISRFEIGCWIQ